jgi:hypothetical protein
MRAPAPAAHAAPSAAAAGAHSASGAAAPPEAAQSESALGAPGRQAAEKLALVRGLDARLHARVAARDLEGLLEGVRRRPEPGAALIWRAVLVWAQEVCPSRIGSAWALPGPGPHMADQGRGRLKTLLRPGPA